MIKRIMDGQILIAIVGDFKDAVYGNHFITENELPMQLGIIRKDKDKIPNHIHKIRNRQVKSISNEFHYVFRGKILASLFGSGKNLIAKIILNPGMFCALYNGGHGFKIIKDDTIMLEVKMGNYTTKEEDKEVIE
jgi:hypothetical protein